MAVNRDPFVMSIIPSYTQGVICAKWPKDTYLELGT